MSLPSRRSLAEARIAAGSFDRFLLLYGTLFAAFGVASPFLPALLHERGLGPSEIGAVLEQFPFRLHRILRRRDSWRILVSPAISASWTRRAICGSSIASRT